MKKALAANEYYYKNRGATIEEPTKEEIERAFPEEEPKPAQESTTDALNAEKNAHEETKKSLQNEILAHAETKQALNTANLSLQSLTSNHTMD